MGDWHNFRVVRELWNASNPAVVLHDGFGTPHRWAGEWPATTRARRGVLYAEGVLGPLGIVGPHWRLTHYAAKAGCGARPGPSSVMRRVALRAKSKWLLPIASAGTAPRFIVHRSR